MFDRYPAALMVASSRSGSAARHCTGAFTPSGKSARVWVPHAAQRNVGMGEVLGHEERLRLGQVEHLPGDVVRGHRLAQRLAASRTGFGKMIDRVVGGLAPPQGLARMPLLPARLLAGLFAKDC